MSRVSDLRCLAREQAKLVTDEMNSSAIIISTGAANGDHSSSGRTALTRLRILPLISAADWLSLEMKVWISCICFGVCDTVKKSGVRKVVCGTRGSGIPDAFRSGVLEPLAALGLAGADCEEVEILLLLSDAEEPDLEGVSLDD